MAGSEAGNGTVPGDFRREIERAGEGGHAGDLELVEEELNRFAPNWAAAGLRLIEAARLKLLGSQAARTRRSSVASKARALVFTGHRIDSAERKEPRFPPAAENQARAMIREAVASEVEQASGAQPSKDQPSKDLLGWAGGANGGDILFHEVCAELGIETWLLLAGPRAPYVEASVEAETGDWVRRFDQIAARCAERTRVLSATLELPSWLRSQKEYSIWQRNNLWLLLNAMAESRPEAGRAEESGRTGQTATTLIALWDGKEGDGPGGTRDMVKIAEGRGAQSRILDARRLTQ